MTKNRLKELQEESRLRSALPKKKQRSYESHPRKVLRGQLLIFLRTLKNGARCPICEHPFKNASNMVVDHCHATGKIRGLLCSRCNSALGIFGDNIAGLQRAISYLQQFESKNGPQTIENKEVI